MRPMLAIDGIFLAMLGARLLGPDDWSRTMEGAVLVLLGVFSVLSAVVGDGPVPRPPKAPSGTVSPELVEILRDDERGRRLP